jgi:hypothetical protein
MDRTATSIDPSDRVCGEARPPSGQNHAFPDPITEVEVARIASMHIAELRALWRIKFKGEPPKAFGPDLLRRNLAQKVQENAYGGLDPQTARLLNQLIAQYSKNNGKIVLPRRIKAGAVLVRDWKGKRHTVTVQENGFRYEGESYESLSEIARLITGTRWNGPRFFGLRHEDQKNAG